MTRPLRILFVSPEVHPFAKTGGLGDVAHALPCALAQLGHEVRVMIPKYRSVEKTGRSVRSLGLRVAVPVGRDIVSGWLYEGHLHRTVPVYFLRHDLYFNRATFYGDAYGDFGDNAERFIFFCRAALEACRALNFQPDIIHCNDWQTGLIPCYLKTLYHHDPYFEGTRSVFSIHNLGYQGNFESHKIQAAHLPWKSFTPNGLEFYGRFSFLKSGLVYADGLTTVSPTYRREILTSENGFHMDGILREHRDKLFGILNGVDYGEWDPRVDTRITARYGPRSLEGKRKCRNSLLRKLSLKLDNDTPVICMVTRLSTQKGIGLLADCFPELMKLNAALVILGSGDVNYETFLKHQGRKFPDRFRFIQGFDETLAHRIIAGSDLLAMPSLYEPCGLTQMYALRYGTVPVVRQVGGLADTVKPFRPDRGEGTGFLFKNADPGGLMQSLKKALAFYSKKKDWRTLMKNGMKQDFSWDRSARQYDRVYRRIRKNG